MRWTLLVAIGLVACAHSGGSTGESNVAEGGALKTAGARCQGGACSCRAVDQFGRGTEGTAVDEGAPAPGTKRFELRTGRGYDVESITVEGMGTLHKDTTKPEATCGYLDLAPGKHRVLVRAKAKSEDAGMEPSLFIREYSNDKHSWYDTFQMRCGGEGGPCELGHMEEFQRNVQAVPRGIFDPCGSTRVEGVKWNGQRVGNGGTRLAELEVELTLEVYKFPPRFPHGAPTCKGPSPTEKAE